jgi:hypothetical protein
MTDVNAQKWYKYLSKALKTKNPNMRKYFNKKATHYMKLVMPDVKLNTKKNVTPPTDRYGKLRDKMIDEE